MKVRFRMPGGTAIPRNGITLYEVVLSTVIFMMAMAGISQVISTGSRASVSAKLQSEAALHAESLMGEVVAGLKDPELAGVTDEPIFEGDDRWTWTLAVQRDYQDIQYLHKLTLTVKHTTTDNRVQSYTVERLMRDPQFFTDVAEADAEKEADAAAEAEGEGM